LYRNHSSWFDSSFDHVRTKQEQQRQQQQYWRSTLDCFQIVLSSVLSEFVILILVLLGSLTCSSISIVIPYIYHFVSILQKFNKIRQHRNQHACLRRWTRWRSMHKLCVFANEQESASTSRLDFDDKASSRAHEVLCPNPDWSDGSNTNWKCNSVDVPRKHLMKQRHELHSMEMGNESSCMNVQGSALCNVHSEEVG
jgi:hypothetical protein